MLGRWFHRNINGIEAENLLREFGQNGSFLIRPSQSTINSYTLSVRCTENIFKHIKIQNNGDSGYEIGEGSSDKFATLAELVDHFIMKETLRDKLDGSILVLKYPLNCKEPTSERYFHGAISGQEATKLLQDKGKPGSYLVRESRSEPQNYVLCVRCENNRVVHLIIKYTDKGYTMHSFEKFLPTLDEFINECIKMCPIVDVRDNVVYLKQPLNSSRINVSNFNIRFNELFIESRYKNKNGFSEEFESLQQIDGKFLYERNDGCKSENRAKNRFKTILPFDYNRIKLKNRTNKPNDPSESDYINANRIQSDESFGKTYLATQGPLVNTCSDFWSMIWQEESQIILMITHEEEKGREKCFRYWPPATKEEDPKNENNFSATYKNLKITLLKLTKICDDYIVRNFLMTDLNTNETRKVYQYQYLAWSDHGVPENIQNTLDFIQDFNCLYKEICDTVPKSRSFPLTVHCSAGIGRTGAIIAIDMILDKIKICGIQCDIDIYKTVCSLRAQRSGMIQTEKQYQFLYIAIRNFIQSLNIVNQIDSRVMQNANFMSTSTPRTSSLQSISN
ncbi:tyrosine- phosphatase corkscrew isoform X2 [Brachionus plicatilis]|uniref:protein-tyrosine-phosphatase n=1 Tax=Brachionus plicatilis TaxID=10195 RepID=A0A3M7RTJ6_BRAPC|nr:tyrosine- phosphatase corkscrew isoform X2 [Brachionus plicatilis]